MNVPAIVRMMAVIALCWAPLIKAAVTFDVRCGAADVDDWIVEAPLDLAYVAKLEGIELDDSITASVVEIDAAGHEIADVPSQFDVDEDQHVVVFLVPGRLVGGQARHFRLGFDRPSNAVPPPAAVHAESSDHVTRISNRWFGVEHARVDSVGSLNVKMNEKSYPLICADRISDGNRAHPTVPVNGSAKLAAAGPLRAILELEGVVDSDARVRSRYRYTMYASQPFVRVQNLLRQESPRSWSSAHFLEIELTDLPVDLYVTDRTEGKFAGTNDERKGDHWAVAYGAEFLMAVLDCSRPTIIDSGSGSSVASSTRGAISVWDSLTQSARGALLFGAGPGDIERVRAASAMLASPPSVEVRVTGVNDALVNVDRLLRERTTRLATLSGDEWSSACVGKLLSEYHVNRARSALAGGRLDDVIDCINAAKAALAQQTKSVKMQRIGGLEAGFVDDRPFLANQHVAYLFAKSENGGGLVAMFDRHRSRSHLQVDPDAAPLWQAAIREGDRRGSVSNMDGDCQIEPEVSPSAAKLSMSWSGRLRTAVEFRLTADDSLARSRIRLKAVDENVGLMTVVYPIVQDILPLSADAAKDQILETWSMGWRRPSPLVSGSASAREYPDGMQFTALLGGDGEGLYFAEEDGTAARKTLSWTPQTESGTLGFSISHPVLNWGSDTFVREYELPGDAVLGPFAGDWFDAAQLYRAWAVTAPWCRKGPMHQRADYPQWLAQAPYVNIAELGDEAQIKRVQHTHQFFDVPIGVAHAYNYYFSRHMDDRYPEMFPPKLGSENFKRVVAELQGQGIMVVPYVNGWIWDQDTESYRATNARQNAALLDRNGHEHVMTVYGFGQRMAGMDPSTELWRRTILDVSKELVGKYGVAGIYYDFLNLHTSDCFNKAHGHPLGGGNFWSASVHGFYDLMRKECRKLNPEFMMTGEESAEWLIDVLDSFLHARPSTNAPLFLAVYHGYTQVWGGYPGNCAPHNIGRWWLLGGQNGWNNWETRITGQTGEDQWLRNGEYYRMLLKCHWEFGRPYLAYGRMLRPPTIAGDLPTVTGDDTYFAYTVQVVEASAWLAPDGSVGIFILNYDDQPHEITWTADLAEIAGLSADKSLTRSIWSPEAGESVVGVQAGGVISEPTTIAPRGLLAIKFEEVK